MKKIILLILLSTMITGHTQSLSKTEIIYEYKSKVILNNGEQYSIQLDKPYYDVSDPTIELFMQSDEHLLRLNRVLTLTNEDNHIELIEWVKGTTIKFYISRKISDAITITGNY